MNAVTSGQIHIQTMPDKFSGIFHFVILAYVSVLKFPEQKPKAATCAAMLQFLALVLPVQLQSVTS